MRVVRESVQDVVLKHDTSRIVQTLVKYGNQAKIVGELKERYKELVQKPVLEVPRDEADPQLPRALRAAILSSSCGAIRHLSLDGPTFSSSPPADGHRHTHATRAFHDADLVNKALTCAVPIPFELLPHDDWNTPGSSQTLVHMIPGHAALATSVCRPDCTMRAAGGRHTYPHIFLRDLRVLVATENICSLVALAADGLALYAVSSDGTLAVFAFGPPKLEGITPADTQRLYLAKFGFMPPFLPNGFCHGPLAGPGERVTTLVACPAPKDRRRLQPTFLGSFGANGSSTSDAPAPAPPSIIINTVLAPLPTSVSAFSTGFGTGIDLDLGFDREQDFGLCADLDMAVPVSALDTRGRHTGRGNVAVSYGEEGNGEKACPRRRRARSTGTKCATAMPRSERRARSAGRAPAHPRLRWGCKGRGWDWGLGMKMGGTGGAEPEDVPRGTRGGDRGRARGAQLGEPSEVLFFAAKEKSVQWLDYLPARALHVCTTARFCAVALEDGAACVLALGQKTHPHPCLFSSHYSVN
ncbi:hypothetical protein DFH11DRAFT_1733172 [Phellopilus nigrolimitatus]|nr:hypothetical protein DFH11DRAFT_1733172 [Phellopilus nigrolimitatus]